jgi:hypothetical protein
MALLFAEHCDNWANLTAPASTGRGWVESGSPGSDFFYATGGVNNGGVMRRMYTNDGYYRGVYRDVTGNASRVHCAWWYRCTNSGTGTSLLYISGVAVGGNWCGVRGQANGAVTVDLMVPIGTNGTSVGACTTDVCDGGWHYLEFEIALHQTAGTAKLWVDGALEVNFSGATCSAAPPLALTRWIVTAHASNGYLDDLILWTDVDNGDGWTTNLGGGVRLFKVVRPTSDASVQFTRSTGSTSYTLVDEQTLATSDYVESGTDGHIDRYGFADHGLTNVTPHGVIVETVAVNPGAGAINVALVAELSSTVAESPVVDVPGGNKTFQWHFPAKPGGGSWSLSDIDSATFGVKADVP